MGFEFYSEQSWDEFKKYSKIDNNLLQEDYNLSLKDLNETIKDQQTVEDILKKINNNQPITNEDLKKIELTDQYKGSQKEGTRDLTPEENLKTLRGKINQLNEGKNKLSLKIKSDILMKPNNNKIIKSKIKKFQKEGKFEPFEKNQKELAEAFFDSSLIQNIKAAFAYKSTEEKIKTNDHRSSFAKFFSDSGELFELKKSKEKCEENPYTFASSWGSDKMFQEAHLTKETLMPWTAQKEQKSQNNISNNVKNQVTQIAKQISDSTSLTTNSNSTSSTPLPSQRTLKAVGGDHLTNASINRSS